MKLGVTLVLTVTQVYVFVNLRRVTCYPVFSRSTNLESKLIDFFVLLKYYSAQSVFGVTNRSHSVKLGIFPIFCRHWHPIMHL